MTNEVSDRFESCRPSSVKHTSFVIEHGLSSGYLQ